VNVPKESENRLRMAKLRVLIVGPISGDSPGGVRTLLNELLASPLVDYVDVSTFSSSKRTRPDRWLITGVMSQIGMLWGLLVAVLQSRAQVVHIHHGARYDFFRKSLDVLLVRMLGRKAILHVHADDFDKLCEKSGKLLQACIRWALRRCNKVVVMSEYWHGVLSGMTDPGRLAVVPNGVRGAAYRNLPPREASRAVFNVPEGRRLIVNLGALGTFKGKFDMLDAAAIVRKTHPEAYWIAAGPDDSREPGATQRLLDRIGELGLDDTASLPGAVDVAGRHKLYAAADVFLLPSHGENFPMVVLEAMAAGLPIVATRVGAVPEMIKDGETGLLIEPKDPEAIAEAVCELLDAPERAAELGRQARERFDELYEVDGPISKMWAELYNAEQPFQAAD